MKEMIIYLNNQYFGDVLTTYTTFEQMIIERYENAIDGDKLGRKACNDYNDILAWTIEHSDFLKWELLDDNVFITSKEFEICDIFVKIEFYKTV